MAEQAPIALPLYAITPHERLFNIKRTSGIVNVTTDTGLFYSAISTSNIRYISVAASTYTSTYFNYAEIQNITVNLTYQEQGT